MDIGEDRTDAFIYRLQRFLPSPVHARPQLLKTLKERAPGASTAAKLVATTVFDAGDSRGLFCKIHVAFGELQSGLLVAPISHISFGRRHPITLEIAARRQGARAAR